MRTLVITGGTGDLGAVVVPRLARDYRCLVAYRTRESFDKLAPHANVRGIAAFEEVTEPVYGLVHLAGAFAMGSSPDDFARLLDVNLMSAVRALHAVTPRLEDGARIVAISTIATLTHPKGLAAYTASKAALNALIQTAAKDLASRRITANALLPGSMDTPANVAGTAREQLVPTAHVAETIAFLLSEAGAHITGQLIALS
jgi:NAD(P)-dependent dehydrogenase (short-subunit alcohol dehydrogenase family)